MPSSPMVPIVVLLLALAARPAAAASSMQIIWHDTGTPTITVSPDTDTVLRASVVLVGDAAGISGFGFSFAFDTDLEDELDIAPASELSGCGACTPGGAEQSASIPGGPPTGNRFNSILTRFNRNQVESTGSSAGLLGSFDQIAPIDLGLMSGTVTLGSVFFKTNAANVRTDGVDVEIVVAPDQFDAILDFEGNDISSSVVFAGASVNAPAPLPIPAWGPLGGSLLLFGSAALLFRRAAATGRRRSASE